MVNQNSYQSSEHSHLSDFTPKIASKGISANHLYVVKYKPSVKEYFEPTDRSRRKCELKIPLSSRENWILGNYIWPKEFCFLAFAQSSSVALHWPSANSFFKLLASLTDHHLQPF